MSPEKQLWRFISTIHIIFFDCTSSRSYFKKNHFLITTEELIFPLKTISKNMISSIYIKKDHKNSSGSFSICNLFNRSLLLTKADIAIERLSIMQKSNLFDRIKRNFFQDVIVRYYYMDALPER